MITHPSYLSVRKPAKNLKPGDEILFQHAALVEIPATETFILHRASILKNNIFLPQRFHFYARFSHILKVSRLSQIKKLSLYLLPGKKLDRGVWITDEWSAEYFHWFTDALPRLVISEQKFGRKPAILPEQYKNIPYVAQSLAILNWKAIYYNTARRLSVSELFMVSHTAPTGNYNKEIINNLRKRFLGESVPEATEKIYVSRRTATRRSVENGETVADILTAAGFTTHFLKDYPLAKQIRLLAKTKMLAGLHGAGLTNMLFMPPGGQILEFRHAQDAHNNAYFSLASDLQHNYYYLRCNATGDDPHTANVTVDPIQLREVLETLLQPSHV